MGEFVTAGNVMQLHWYAEELEAERALANRLAEALEAVLPASGLTEEFTVHGDDWFYELGRKTLAAYHEKRNA